MTKKDIDPLKSNNFYQKLDKKRYLPSYSDSPAIHLIRFKESLSDIVIIDQSLTPKNGDTVLADIGEKIDIFQFYRLKDDEIILKKDEPINFDRSQLLIQGVVIGTIRKF